MANGRVPFDAKVAAENIEIVAMLNRLPFTAFVEGSDKGNTRAKPEIWTAEGQVRCRVAKSQEDVAKLAAAGKTGNLDQIKAAVRRRRPELQGLPRRLPQGTSFGLDARPARARRQRSAVAAPLGIGSLRAASRRFAA